MRDEQAEALHKMFPELDRHICETIASMSEERLRVFLQKEANYPPPPEKLVIEDAVTVQKK